MGLTLPATKRLDTRNPFTRADARAAGLTVRQLLGHRFHKVFYDLYVSADVMLTPHVRARAAIKVAGPGAYASHHTAAELWGLPVPEHSATHVSVLRAGDRIRRQGIQSHLGQAHAGRVRHQGVLVTSPEQTFIDLAATRLTLVELVVIGDAMLAARLATQSSLIEAIDAWNGDGTRLARRATRLIREGVDSPMETRLRLLIVLAGLPEPRVNLILRADDGTWRLRFDLVYEDSKVIVEYDGRQHAENDRQWERDILRREELDRLGYRIVVVTARGIYAEPQQTIARVREALRERGATVPSRLRTEWTRHFRAGG